MALEVQGRGAHLWQNYCEREADQQPRDRAQDEWTTAHGCPVVHKHQADGQGDDSDDHTQCQWWPRPARFPEGLKGIVISSHGSVVPRLKTLPAELEEKEARPKRKKKVLRGFPNASLPPGGGKPTTYRPPPKPRNNIMAPQNKTSGR